MKIILDDRHIDRNTETQYRKRIYSESLSIIEHEPCVRTIKFTNGHSLQIELPYVQFYRSIIKKHQTIDVNGTGIAKDFGDAGAVDCRITFSLTPLKQIKETKELYCVPLPNVGDIFVCMGDDWNKERTKEINFNKEFPNEENKYCSNITQDCTHFWTAPFSFELLENLENISGVYPEIDDDVIEAVESSFRQMLYLYCPVIKGNVGANCVEFAQSVIETLHKP